MWLPLPDPRSMSPVADHQECVNPVDHLMVLHLWPHDFDRPAPKRRKSRPSKCQLCKSPRCFHLRLSSASFHEGEFEGVVD